MKILIVDDELVSRSKLEAILENFGQCTSVESGEAAVGAVRSSIEAGDPFQLITLDIAMPGMSGTQALYEIRCLEAESGLTPLPKARIVMVTAQSNRDSLITCVQAGCDDYVIKPFDQEMILQRLTRFEALAKEIPLYRQKMQEAAGASKKVTEKVSIGQEVIRRFKRGEINLPSPSNLYMQFKNLVHEGAGLLEIADLLKQDMGISFHLISVSNSVYYRGIRETKTLQEALSRLGLDITLKYMEIICNRGLYTATHKGYAPFMDRLWEHSVSTALATESIFRLCKILLSHDAFTLGLLHDVGKMVLIQIVSELETRGKLGEGINRAEVLGMLDQYHGEFGDVALKQWKFPKAFSNVARWHNNLEHLENVPRELAAVHLANLVSKAGGYGQRKPLEIDLTQARSTEILQLDAAMLEEIVRETAEGMTRTKKALVT